jgi:hypothetical protein
MASSIVHHDGRGGGGADNASIGTDTVGTGGGIGYDAKQPYRIGSRRKGVFCGCCAAGYDYRAELLEYDYTHQQLDGKGSAMQSPATYPRIRERGEFYIDSYNDQPWSWSYGTNEDVSSYNSGSSAREKETTGRMWFFRGERVLMLYRSLLTRRSFYHITQNGTWCNSSDQAGTIMSAMVWLLMLYSAFTVTALTLTEGIPVITGEIYAVLVFMSLASHAKTSFTDPGSVPVTAIPSERQRMLRDSHSMCGQCQTFKPPGSHHCRICNRCISRMDHHCPWMNVSGTNTILIAAQPTV